MIKVLTCKRCGHSWEDNMAQPIKCPKCGIVYPNIFREHKLPPTEDTIRCPYCDAGIPIKKIERMVK